MNFDRLLCVSITFEGNGIHTLSAYYLMYICLPEILHQLNSRGVWLAICTTISSCKFTRAPFITELQRKRTFVNSNDLLSLMHVFLLSLRIVWHGAESSGKNQSLTWEGKSWKRGLQSVVKHRLCDGYTRTLLSFQTQHNEYNRCNASIKLTRQTSGTRRVTMAFRSCLSVV